MLLTAQLEEQEALHPHGLRLGWSIANTSLLLGKDHFHHWVFFTFSPFLVCIICLHSGFLCVSFQVKMTSLLHMMGRAKKCLVGWKRSLENPFQWATSLAVTL